MLHFNIISPLKAAKAHLLQPVCFYELCAREQHLSGLPGAAKRGNIHSLRENICLAQHSAPGGRKRDIPLPLIALFGIVFGQAVTQ